VVLPRGTLVKGTSVGEMSPTVYCSRETGYFVSVS